MRQVQWLMEVVSDSMGDYASMGISISSMIRVEEYSNHRRFVPGIITSLWRCIIRRRSSNQIECKGKFLPLSFLDTTSTPNRPHSSDFYVSISTSPPTISPSACIIILHYDYCILSLPSNGSSVCRQSIAETRRIHETNRRWGKPNGSGVRRNEGNKRNVTNEMLIFSIDHITSERNQKQHDDDDDEDSNIRDIISSSSSIHKINYIEMLCQKETCSLH